MAKRPDLVVNADIVDQRVLVDKVHEGVVVRNPAILVQPDYLAHVGLHILRRRELLSVA